MASQLPAKKNTAFNLGLTLYTSSGAFVAAPTSVNAQVSKDFGAWAGVGNSSIVSTVYGQIKLALNSSEMNADVVMLYVTDTGTANCMPFTAAIYTAAGTFDELSTAVTGESARLSTTMQAESTRLSTAIYGESTKLSTLIVSRSTQVKVTTVEPGAIGVTSPVDAFWYRMGIIGWGTAQQTDSTSITLASTHTFANDELIGAVALISSGTGFGQSRSGVDYIGASDKLSVDTWTTTPSSVCDYVLLAAPPASVLSLPSVRVTSMDTNVISAESVSVGAVSKISSGLATSTALSSGFAAQTAVLSTLAASVALRATSTEVSSGFAAQTAILSTMATSIGLRATSTEVSSGFAAQTAILSTMATSIGLRATSTEVSSGFAAQTSILSTMAAAVSSIVSGSTHTAAQAASAVMGSTVDGAYTLTQVLRGVGSILLGKVSGSSGSTTIFRDMNDTKARVTAVTDTSGNRSIVTLDLT